MIWREKRVLLAILGLLLAANTLFFFTYRVQYQTRVQDLEDRRGKAEAQLTQARSKRKTAEGHVATFRNISADVQDVYTKQWSTEDKRLVPFISEVKRLAVASDLAPDSYAFGRVAKSKKDGVNAETVSVNFSVHGTYQQVRRLINLIELSQQFVIINQIALTSSDQDGELTVTLQLETLFRDTVPAAGRES